MPEPSLAPLHAGLHEQVRAAPMYNIRSAVRCYRSFAHASANSPRSMASLVGSTLALASFAIRALAGETAQVWLDTTLGVGGLHSSVDHSEGTVPAEAVATETDEVAAPAATGTEAAAQQVRRYHISSAHSI